MITKFILMDYSSYGGEGIHGIYFNRADAEEFVLTESYYRAMKEAHFYNLWDHHIPRSYNFTYPMVYSMYTYASEIEIEEWEI